MHNYVGVVRLVKPIFTSEKSQCATICGGVGYVEYFGWKWGTSLVLYECAALPVVYFAGDSIPYRGKLRRGKVTKFSSSDENFPRRKFSPAKLLPR